MDELNLFRDFRSGVAAPSEASEKRAFARLTSAIEDVPVGGTRVPRLFRQRSGRLALAVAALAGATVAALFISTPWTSSPGFLERAQAALTPPPDTVLHTKWNWTVTATDSSCTVTRGPNEMWIDQRPPHRYRGVLKFGLPDPSGSVCALGRPGEGGGTLDTREAFLVVPPDSLTPIRQGYFGPPDWVAMLRQAINDGTAHDEGRTELDGRTVERIRVDGPFGPTYFYVDPESFYPIQIEETGRALTGTFKSVVSFMTYEYLPGTRANRALADIRAQHPNATGP